MRLDDVGSLGLVSQATHAVGDKHFVPLALSAFVEDGVRWKLEGAIAIRRKSTPLQSISTRDLYLLDAIDRRYG